MGGGGGEGRRGHARTDDAFLELARRQAEQVLLRAGVVHVARLDLDAERGEERTPIDLRARAYGVRADTSGLPIVPVPATDYLLQVTLDNARV